MFHSEKQTRQVYAVASAAAETGTALPTADNEAKIYTTLDGKVYSKIGKKSHVTGKLEYVATDKVNPATITKMAISCPKGKERAFIDIKLDETVLKAYPLATMKITFPNWEGPGIENSKFKVIDINATALNNGTSMKDFVYDLSKQIRNAFKHESWIPFDVLAAYAGDTITKPGAETKQVVSVKSVTGAHIYLVERSQVFNPDNLIFNNTLDMLKKEVGVKDGKPVMIYKNVDCSIAIKHDDKATTGERKQYSDKPFAAVTAMTITEAIESATTLVTSDATHTITVNGKAIENPINEGYLVSPAGNYREIYELEHVGLKKRADLHGMAGWPNVNPTPMSGVVTDPTANYFCLDIHYHSMNHDHIHPDQEKTITYIAADVTTLETIGNTYTKPLVGSSGTQSGTKMINGAKGATAAITATTVAKPGDAWIATL